MADPLQCALAQTTNPACALFRTRRSSCGGYICFYLARQALSSSALSHRVLPTLHMFGGGVLLRFLFGPVASSILTESEALMVAHGTYINQGETSCFVLFCFVLFSFCSIVVWVLFCVEFQDFFVVCCAVSLPSVLPAPTPVLHCGGLGPLPAASS